MTPAKKSSNSRRRSRSAVVLSDDHKAALAAGRVEGRAVARYLEALDATKPRRGRRRSPEKTKERIAEIEEALADGSVSAVKRLTLVQERLDLQASLEVVEPEVDLAALEEAFVDAAGSYANRKSISYAAFREVGVPASVLRRAGINS